MSHTRYSLKPAACMGSPIFNSTIDNVVSIYDSTVDTSHHTSGCVDSTIAPFRCLILID